MKFENAFTRQVGIEFPILCGAMYPCSNPELVAAVSEAGGMGVLQPLSMVYAHKKDFRAGMHLIKSLTQKPVGMNIITEKSSKIYEDRMRAWLDIALEEGVRFFVTSLGNPRWVVDRVQSVGGIVYHDVVDRRWAQKALDSGVHGIICVNNRAGGHAGTQTPQQLFAEMSDLGVPLICAGGIGSAEGFQSALAMGYDGIQMGTRFIATSECTAHADYKNAILRAHAADIVLTEKISGVPVAVINTPYIERTGTKANFAARYMLKHHKMKHWMRFAYTAQSIWKLKRASHEGAGYKDYWQAGKSVDGIEKIETSAEIIQKFMAALS